MRAILTVIGKDRRGIIAAVSTRLAELGANIEDISQTLMQDNFVMIMVVGLSGVDRSLKALNEEFGGLAEQLGVSIRLQREEIFQAMHRI